MVLSSNPRKLNVARNRFDKDHGFTFHFHLVSTSSIFFEQSLKSSLSLSLSLPLSISISISISFSLHLMYNKSRGTKIDLGQIMLNTNNLTTNIEDQDKDKISFVESILMFHVQLQDFAVRLSFPRCHFLFRLWRMTNVVLESSITVLKNLEQSRGSIFSQAVNEQGTRYKGQSLRNSSLARYQLDKKYGLRITTDRN